MSSTPIIVRRVESDDHGGHHGGGWKIAYADFMTAMMAFFLLLWLVGAADEEQRKGLADYFAPSFSEAGGRGQGVLAGQIPSPDGVLSGGETEGEGRRPIPRPEDPLSIMAEPVRGYDAEADTPVGGVEGDGPSDEQHAEVADFPGGMTPSESPPPASSGVAEAEAIREAIQAAVAAAPELDELKRNLRFEARPEGLWVQIVDDERRSMFEVGSAELRGRPLALVRAMARVVAAKENPIVITGHTDSLQFRGGGDYTNWELSTDRAHATRRELVALGVAPGRVLRITGMADTEPFDAARPEAPQNRRIGILIATADTEVASIEQAEVHFTLP